MDRCYFIPKAIIPVYLILLFLSINASMDGQGLEKSVRSVQIDGYLNEQIWPEAKKFTDLVQIEPEIYAPSSVISEFYFTYDSQNIYFGGKLFQNRNSISAGNARKDDVKTSNGDYITIGFDPLNNGNSAYFILINPVNAQADGIIDINGNFDHSWDAVFSSETKINDDYWTFELKIPLTSINFQNKEIQTWGLMFSRRYAYAQETSINQIIDKNVPFRVSDFMKIQDIKSLKKERKMLFTPYLYGYGDYFKLNDSLTSGVKAGGEIKYNPTPSTTILATFNPDYAQIETDKEIINVSDLPTTYPEKRPFFIESSDMYPGLAVNTRNIIGINAGLKFRHVGKISKIDFTSVYDKQKNLWGLGNIRLTDNKRYHFEIISGIKSEKTDYMKDYNYNVTLHGKLYFYNKQLQVYSWFGTINMPNGKANEYESVNAVKWMSRTWKAGIWNHIKSELYNPNIVGSPALSNEIITNGWFGYTLYDEKGFFRKTSIISQLARYDLFTSTGNEYFENITELNNQLYMGNSIGNWELSVSYKPKIEQKFRFRNQFQFNEHEVFSDAFSSFVLINQSAHSFKVLFKTDPSKKIGTEFNFDNSLIRQSKSNNYVLESYVKIGSKVTIAYSYNLMDIEGSNYQRRYKQAIHRIKTEYNITDKMNVRLIFQPNQVRIPTESMTNENLVCNLTYSWEFIPGGNVYIVYNNYRNNVQYSPETKYFTDNNHTLIMKISKTF